MTAVVATVHETRVQAERESLRMNCSIFNSCSVNLYNSISSVPLSVCLGCVGKQELAGWLNGKLEASRVQETVQNQKYDSDDLMGLLKK